MTGGRIEPRQPEHTRRQSRGRGFTLVELLVVIGIIAVLIGILVPVLSRARAAANRAACLSNVKQLYTGILMYCNDNHGWFPTCAYPDDGTAYKQYADDWIWWEANRNLDDSPIAKYVGRGEQLRTLLRCPADRFDGRKQALAIAPGQGPYLYSYGFNEGAGVNSRGAMMRTKITQWRVASRKILISEVLEKLNTAPVWTSAVESARRHGTGVSHGTGYTAAGQRMGVNVTAVFIDGHAEGVDEDFARTLFQVRPDLE